ncbi:MAG: outer membrane protein assembly factor BamE [Rhodospirillales bacterium]|nr:outer membrane protein assembly factor BamE [Rhodospirillales bacterium]
MRKFRSVVILGACLLASCATRIETRGNLPDPDLLETVRSSESSRDEIAQILGTPSTTAMFENETWFYISERRETFAFFEPEVLDRKIVIIQFNDAGTLKTVAEVGLENGRIVIPVDRETPTLGNDLNAIQQLLGNIGKFNKE